MSNLGKTIDQLPAAVSLNEADLFLIEQAGVAKGVPVSVVQSSLFLVVPTSAGYTPDVGSLGASILYEVNDLNQDVTFSAPAGTPQDGQRLIIRITDDGTPRSLAWNVIYRAGATIALPIITIAGVTMYLGFIYNSLSSGTWDLILVA